MNWREKANEILAKVKRHAEDSEGWKVAKKSKEATVFWKPSSDWSGALYKSESIMNADPATVFSFIDPDPNGPRSKWDKAIKELQIVDKVDSDLTVVRTITHSAFGGIISSRDFVDLIANVNNDECIATNAQGVEHPGMPVSSDHVRGNNYPCGIYCYKIPEDANKTRVVSYIQTDLGGMLPKSVVESALPSNMIDFCHSLKKALKEAGKWKD